MARIFPEFNFLWLVEEMKRNLPKELDFCYEANNAEKVAKQFSHFPWLKVTIYLYMGIYICILIQRNSDTYVEILELLSLLSSVC